MSVKREWHMLAPEEQQTICWKVMRLFEEQMPREAKVMFQLNALANVMSDIPQVCNVSLDNSIEQIINDLSEKHRLHSTVCGLAITNLNRSLYAIIASKYGVDILVKVQKLLSDEGVDTEDNLASMLNNISEKMCQDFIR